MEQSKAVINYKLQKKLQNAPNVVLLQDFAIYFRKEIHPDMNRMGAWMLAGRTDVVRARAPDN